MEEKIKSEENENINEEVSESTIDIRLILDAICGETGIKNHPAKCVSIVNNSTFHKGEIEEDDIAIEQSENVVFSVQRRGQFVYICMNCKYSEHDFDAYFKLFEEYGKFQEQLADSPDIFVANTLTIIPNAFPQFNIIAVNPMVWYMQPESSDSVKMTQIMALYHYENVSFNVNNIDDTKIEDSVVSMYVRQIEQENIEIVNLQDKYQKLSEELVLKKGTEEEPANEEE